eukprot:SAG25_NODE_801_length_5268_cov_3.548849_5_plen_105_part_00
MLAGRCGAGGGSSSLISQGVLLPKLRAMSSLQVGVIALLCYPSPCPLSLSLSCTRRHDLDGDYDDGKDDGDDAASTTAAAAVPVMPPPLPPLLLPLVMRDDDGL